MDDSIHIQRSVEASDHNFDTDTNKETADIDEGSSFRTIMPNAAIDATILADQSLNAEANVSTIQNSSCDITDTGGITENASMWEEELQLANELRNIYTDTNIEDGELEADIFIKLGQLYNRRGIHCQDINERSKHFIKASALFNSAKIRVQNKDKLLELQNIMRQNEVDFMTFIGCNDIKIPLLSSDAHKIEIEGFRNNIATKLKQIWDESNQNLSSGNSDETRIANENRFIQNVRALCYEIVEGMKLFIRSILRECYSAIGFAPQDFAVVGLGSLARNEMTPYSDLEFMILINNENEDDKQYFRNLTNLFHLFVLNLGETPLPAIGVKSLNDFDSKKGDWYFDFVTTNGFCFDGAMPWACKTPVGRPRRLNKMELELIKSPEEMSKYLDTEIAMKEGYHVSEIIRTVTFIDGNLELVDKFIQLSKIAGNDSKVRQHGLDTLNNDISDFSSKMNLHKQDIPAAVHNVKKEIYRLPTIVTNSFKLILNLHGNTPWELLEEMNSKEMITTEGSHNLQMAVSIAVIFRLKTYMVNGGQKENISFLQQIFTSAVESETIYHVENTNHIFRYYFTLLPLIQSLSNMNKITIYQFPDILRHSIFYEKSAKIEGDIYLKLCYYKKASKSYELVRESSSRKADRKYADLLRNLAFVYYYQDQYDSALSYGNQCLQANKNLHDDETDSGIASTLNVMALVHFKQGEYDKALSLHQQSLAKWKEVAKGEAHPDVATLNDNIAVTYTKKGECDKALTYHQHSLDMRRQLYGDGPDPHVATSLNNMAEVYRTQGEYDKALDYNHDALDMDREVYGDGAHPDVAISLNNLGLVHYYKYDYGASLLYYYQSLNIAKQVYGESPHPHVALTLGNLAEAYRAIGQYDIALSYHQQSLDMGRKIHSEGAHHDVAASLNNIALVYKEQEEYDTALFYQEQALKMNKYLYGDGPHPEIATALNNLAGIYDEQGEYNQALMLSHRSLDMRRQVFADDAHPDVALSLHDTGFIYHELEDFDHALTYYQESLKMREVLYGKGVHHANIAALLHNIAEVYLSQGKYDKALTYHQQSLVMNRQLYGGDTYDDAHPSINHSLHCLSNVYEALGDEDNALSYKLQADEMDKLLS